MGNKKDKIVLIGGGGHCKSVLDSLICSARFNEIAITDNAFSENETLFGCKVIGSDDKLPDLYSSGITNAFISIGSIKDTALRRRLFENAYNIGFEFPNIIDDSAIISDRTEIGEGVFVGKGVIINADCKIKKFAIINSGAIIEHECEVGEFTHISVGATVCGGSIIEDDVFIGANATIIQGVKIGMNSIIGAGSVILSDVPANTKAIGVWGGYNRLSFSLIVKIYVSKFKLCFGEVV